MMDVVIVDGKARGIITRNLLTGDWIGMLLTVLY
jgi:hypothetical protein